MPAGPLGRRPPSDWAHVQRYALAEAAAIPRVPVTLGINWYRGFDEPVRDGRIWRIPGEGGLGAIRGGHGVCVAHDHTHDSPSWWAFYAQQTDGPCLGYAASRMMSLMNRRRYQAPWLYDQAQLVDEWADTPPEPGTSTRAVMDVLRTQGHERVGRASPELSEGIWANRWATTVDEVRAVLQNPLHDKRHAVPVLNSWYPDYPRVVWLDYDVLAQLLREDGECAVVTDK